MRYALPLLVLILAVAFGVAPFLTEPFSGFTADQLPVPQVDPPIQPAGYAFAIWGLIYAGLVASALIGLFSRPGDPEWDEVRPPLAISLAVGVPWLSIANASPVWATVAIFVMAIAAITALLRTPDDDHWTLTAPVALYAGWLTAASFVSLGATAAGYGLVTGPVGWAVIGIVAAFAVAWAVQTRARHAPEYGLAVIWALIGIVVKNGAEGPVIAGLAAAGALALAALLATRARWPALSRGAS